MPILKQITRWTYAPLMLLTFNGAAIALVHSDAPKVSLAGLLLAAIAMSFLAEQYIPYQEDWNHPKGDTLRDGLHALVNESSIVMSVLLIPLLAALTPFPTIWPESWPLWTQLLIAILLADAGITLIHWASHRNEFLWRFHAVHHSVTRMYGFNGLMKHPFHQAIELFAGTAPLILAGMPLDIAVLLAFAVAIQLLLQHSNADMQIGALRRLLALAPVHRFHHLKSSTEGNVNFGLFTTIWDHILGTARFDADRRFFPGDLGIDNQPAYPSSYISQLIRPFRRGG
ncbi:MAG: fatty acid hydroxylase [Hyphomonadaceae bacterium BRH_c29]|nr:MAG: fatty acid hydroxylase [Hyphomonadaceae bacterium BRH_c29]